MKMAGRVAENPAAGFPKMFGDWGDVKGAYRLFDQEDGTFEAIVTPHWKQTRAIGPGRFLVICDIDFGIHSDIDGLGPTGDGAVVAIEIGRPDRPDRPAKSVVPQSWIDMLDAAEKMPGIHKAEMTVSQFYHTLARQSDGEPGWITNWQGWETLNTMMRGYHLAAEVNEKDVVKCG